MRAGAVNPLGNPLERPAASTTPVAADKFIRCTYDAVGNRLTEATHLGTSTSAYDAGDRLTGLTAAGGAVTTYTYDANGNQIAAGSRTYTYDAADRMTTARIGTTTETYTWSGDGLRLSASTGTQAAKTTRYMWDRNFGLAQLAIERNGSGTTLRSYAYALDLLSQTAGTSSFYYHHDGLGSVSDVTAAAGTPLAWYEYQPFGALRRSGADSKAPTNLFRFTGEYLDTFTGLYHLRARQYDPGLGRFLSQDPVAPTLEDPYVASYVYVGNSPANVVDPSGRCPWCVGAVLGFASYAGGVVLSNVVSGNDDDIFAGFDWREAGIQTAGALSGGLSTVVVGRGSQMIMNGVIGFDATLWTMNLHGRTNPWELLGGTALSAVSPLVPRGPRYIPQFARGLARDSLVNAAGNLMNRTIQRLLPNTGTSASGK